MLHMIILSTSYPFETPEICFLAPGIWTTSALEGTLCFPPWALKLNLPKVVRHWAWEKNQWFPSYHEMQGSRASKIRILKINGHFSFIFDLGFSKATPFNEHRDESAEWWSLLHRFHSLGRVNSKKNTLPKTNKIPTLGPRKNHLQKVPFWGEKTLVPRRVTTLRFSASPCHWKRPRLVWPNQPALKHAGDKAGEGFGNLGGGFKYFLFSPPTGGNDPIWRAYFSSGLKAPTSNQLFGKVWVWLRVVSCEFVFGVKHFSISVWTMEELHKNLCS